MLQSGHEKIIDLFSDVRNGGGVGNEWGKSVGGGG